MQWNNLTKAAGTAILAAGIMSGNAHDAAAVEASVGINLSGTVLEVVAIIISENTITGLVLEPDTTYAPTEISVENESANLGYTVYVNSANLAAGARCTVATTPCLWNSVDDDDVDYNLHDWNGGLAMAFSGGTEAEWVPLAGAKFTLTPDRSVQISYAIGAGEVHAAGSYTDTLTFRIVSE